MDLIYTLYKDSRTVFKLKDVALLLGETDFNSINVRLHYYVRMGKLLNPRKGIYCKHNYNPQELACRIFAPAYISLESVLQSSGIIFQYYSRLTVVSYLSREIEIDNNVFSFRKMKGELLVNTQGIEQHGNTITIATRERAFLDTLYFNSRYYFDNLHPLNSNLIEQILPIYNSETLEKRVRKMFKNQ